MAAALDDRDRWPGGARVAGRTGQRSVRAIVRRIHQWLGLSAGILFALVGLTGSLLVFYPEIDAGIHSANRSIPSGRPQSWEAVDHALRARFPDRPGAWRIEVTPGGGPIPARYFPVDAEGRKALKPFLVWVDPRTARIVRDGRWGSDPMTWVYDLHRRLLLDRPGATAMGVFGLTLVPLLLVSGAWAWWPRGGRFRQALHIRRCAGAIRHLYDVHKLAGLAALAVLPILAVSGSLLNLPDTTRTALATISPPIASPTPRSIPSGHPLPLDVLITHAQRLFPDAALAWIETPGSIDGAAQITFAQPGEPSRRFPRTVVWLDRYSGRILAVRDPHHDPAGDTILNWLHPIHAGELLGPIGRVSVASAGLLPTLLLVTGWLRYRRRSRLSNRPHPGSPTP